MRILDRQKGNTILAAVLGLLAIAVIAAALYYVWHINHDVAPKMSASPQKAAQLTQDSSKISPKTATPYLNIKEWSIRLTLPSQLQNDVEYTVDTTAEQYSGGPIKIDFSSKTINEDTLSCQTVDTNSKTLVAIYRELPGGPQTTTPAPFKQIGDTRYYFAGTACEEAIARGEGSPHDSQVLSELKEAISNTLENY